MDIMEQAVRVRRKCRWCTRYIMRNIWPCRATHIHKQPDRQRVHPITLRDVRVTFIPTRLSNSQIQFHSIYGDLMWPAAVTRTSVFKWSARHFCSILTKSGFATDFRNDPILRSPGNPSSWVHADACGQTAGYDEANNHFTRQGKRIW